MVLARLLDLSEDAGIWVSRNIAFSRRLDFVCVVALDLIKDQKEREDAKKIFAEVAQHNSDRDVLAHSKFEPFKGGVKLVPITGSKKPKPPWSKNKFDASYVSMQKLVPELQKVVAKIKPPKGYGLPAGAGMYAALFSPVPKI